MTDIVNKKNLLIRTDANSLIGAGHIMRCIAVAEAWQTYGGNPVILSNCNSHVIKKRVKDKNITIIEVKSIHPDPFDLNFTLQTIERYRNPQHQTWVVIDGYHFDSEYIDAISKQGFKSVVVDDINHLPYYPSDIILNQNIGSETFNYQSKTNTLKLLGPGFTLIRSEFINYQKSFLNVPPHAKNILITFGGADKNNITLKIINCINCLSIPDLDLKIVIGPENSNFHNIQGVLTTMNLSHSLLQNVNNMAPIMRWADLAITAAGSTCWELALMGVPALLVAVADNQLKVAETLNSKGIMKNLGWWEELTEKEIMKEISIYLLNQRLRCRSIQRGRALIDGKGVFRLLNRIEKYGYAS